MQCGNFSGQQKVLTIDGLKGLIDKFYLFVKIKNKNDITLFRFDRRMAGGGKIITHSFHHQSGL